MSLARPSTRSAPSSASSSPRSGCGDAGGDLVGGAVGRRLARRRGERLRLPLQQRHRSPRTATSRAPPGLRPAPAARRRAPSASASRTSSRSLAAVRLDAVALGDRGDVERRQVEAGRSLHLLDFGEPLEDRVLLVAQDEEGDRRLVGDGAPEGGDRVLRRALAEHADDRAVGLGELDADRGGEAEAEPAAGAEVVAAGAREAQLVAQRQGAGGRLEDDDRRPRGGPRRGRSGRSRS